MFVPVYVSNSFYIEHKRNERENKKEKEMF